VRRWFDIFTRRPAPTSAPVGPLARCEAEIAEAVGRRRETRRARPALTEEKRFARARPKLEQLKREIATMPVPF
jgi:hypothetical protein